MIKEYLIDKALKNKSFPEWMIEGRNAALNKLVSLRHNTKYGLGMYPLLPAVDLANVAKDMQAEVRVEGPENIQVLSLTEAFKIPYYAEVLKTHYNAPFSSEKLPGFAYFLKAFVPQGTLIHIPKGMQEDSPIVITINSKNPTALHYIFILADEDSRVSFIEKNSSKTANGFYGQIVNLHICDNADIEYVRVHKLGVIHFNLQTNTVAANAKLTYLDANMGSTLAESYTQTILAQEKSRVTQMHVSNLGSEQKYDIFSSIVHKAPHTTSEMLSKLILRDTSHAVYRGLTKIETNAPQSSGVQKEDTLLIGEKAKIDTVPILEIENDLVRCHHGAAIQNLDPEKLFYLRSRGLPQDQAEEILTQGFLAPLWEKVSCKAVRQIVLS